MKRKCRLSLHQVNSCVPKGNCLKDNFSRRTSLRPSFTFFPGHSHQHENVTQKIWEHSRVRVPRTTAGIRSCSQHSTVSPVGKTHKDHTDSLLEPGCIYLGTALIFQVRFFQSLLCKHLKGTHMLLQTCTHSSESLKSAFESVASWNEVPTNL